MSTDKATENHDAGPLLGLGLSEGLGRCANAPACGCREAEQQCAARVFARRQQWADRWREMAKAAGWKDTPTVRQAFWCFNISDFASRVAQAESERYAPLMQAVEWLLEDGHMNQEHLARLRAAFERFAQRCPMGCYSVQRKGDGYWSSHTQLMWDAWQAAWN